MIKTYTVSWLSDDGAAQKRKHIVPNILGSHTIESMAYALLQQYGNCHIQSEATNRTINMTSYETVQGTDVASVVADIRALRE